MQSGAEFLVKEALGRFSNDNICAFPRVGVLLLFFLFNFWSAWPSSPSHPLCAVCEFRPRARKGCHHAVFQCGVGHALTRTRCVCVRLSRCDDRRCPDEPDQHSSSQRDTGARRCGHGRGCSTGAGGGGAQCERSGAGRWQRHGQGRGASESKRAEKIAEVG
eukprot:1576158-Rhodomonas_salina.1